MISVIIPAYNAERTLGRCLDSLRAQTIADWEAICVNDGSTDSTAAVLEVYAHRDKRIIPVNKENGGVSEARNMAMEKARGKYVLFVDSDDFIHPQTLEICLLFAEREQADIVAFTYSRFFRTMQTIRLVLHLPEGRRLHFSHYETEKIDSLATDDLLYWSTEFSKVKDGRCRRWLVKHCQPWRCLYRTECVRDIKFIKGIIYEDFPWWSSVVARVGRSVIINLPLYFYYPNFKGFIHSAEEDYKISSLRKAISTVKSEMPRLLDSQHYKMWEDNFLVPFESKLRKKLKDNKR